MMADKKLQAFEKAVERARELLTGIRTSQLEIARLAASVCEKGVGGRISEAQLTYTKFANAIGINRKTLIEWVSIYEYAKDNMPNPPNGTYSREFYALARKSLATDRLARRHNQIGSQSSVRRVQATKQRNEAELNASCYALKFVKYASRMRSQLRKQGAHGIPPGVREEIKVLIADIFQMLDREQGDVLSDQRL